MEKKKPDHLSQLLVMKFGGTSVGSPEAMSQAADIVAGELAGWKGVVPIVSALNGVTNLLLDAAHNAASGNRTFVDSTADELSKRHQSMLDDLVSDNDIKAIAIEEINHLIGEFTNLVQAMYILGEASPRGIDAVGSLGERMCARILSALLNARKIKATVVDATRLIVTDARFTSANPDEAATREKTRRVLLPLIEQGITPV
ncbi:MAG: aspartate kinase, partial [Leptolinea sp.]